MRLVSTFTDEELIAEMQARGYRVARPDQVRDLEVSRTHFMADVPAGHVDRVRGHIRSDLGARIGQYLVDEGALFFHEVESPRTMPVRTEFTARLAVILPEVDTGAPKPGAPGWRPMNCRNRLRDEGRAHPKSGCDSCGDGGLRGCPHTRDEAGQRIRSPQSTMSPR